MRHQTRKTLLLFIFALCLAALPAAAYEPTVVVGLSVEQSLSGSAGASSATSVQGAALSGLLGWRTLLPSGYFALSASGQLNHYLGYPQALYDSESVHAELSLRQGLHRFDLEAGLRVSAAGTASSGAYLRPEWEARYRLERGRRKVRPTAAYHGYYLADEGSSDVLFHGGEIGLLYRPSIRRGYEVNLGGGWELWPEQPIYGLLGAETDDHRRDLTANLEAKTDGLVGYTVDWSLAATGGLRLSNANRYLDDLLPAVLEENSESRWTAGVEALLGYSPTRRISLQAGLFARQEVYLERRALVDGSLSGEALRVLSIGPSLKMDWTADDRLYLVLEGSGASRFSNEPDSAGWQFSLRGGVEFSF